MQGASADALKPIVRGPAPVTNQFVAQSICKKALRAVGRLSGPAISARRYRLISELER